MVVRMWTNVRMRAYLLPLDFPPCLENELRSIFRHPLKGLQADCRERPFRKRRHAFQKTTANHSISPERRLSNLVNEIDVGVIT